LAEWTLRSVETEQYNYNSKKEGEPVFGLGKAKIIEDMDNCIAEMQSRRDSCHNTEICLGTSKEMYKNLLDSVSPLLEKMLDVSRKEYFSDKYTNITQSLEEKQLLITSKYGELIAPTKALSFSAPVSNDIDAEKISQALVTKMQSELSAQKKHISNYRNALEASIQAYYELISALKSLKDEIFEEIKRYKKLCDDKKLYFSRKRYSQYLQIESLSSAIPSNDVVLRDCNNIIAEAQDVLTNSRKHSIEECGLVLPDVETALKTLEEQIVKSQTLIKCFPLTCGSIVISFVWEKEENADYFDIADIISNGSLVCGELAEHIAKLEGIVSDYNNLKNSINRLLEYSQDIKSIVVETVKKQCELISQCKNDLSAKRNKLIKTLESNVAKIKEFLDVADKLKKSVDTSRYLIITPSSVKRLTQK